MWAEMMLEKLRNVSRRRKVLFVATSHLVVLVYGLYATIDEIIMAEEPFDEREAVMVSVHFLFQLVLISCLYIGTWKSKPLWVLPWLSVGFPAFCIATYMAYKYSEIRFFDEFLFNWFWLGVFWYCWYTVYKFYKEDCAPLDNKYSKVKSRQKK